MSEEEVQNSTVTSENPTTRDGDKIMGSMDIIKGSFEIFSKHWKQLIGVFVVYALVGLASDFSLNFFSSLAINTQTKTINWVFVALMLVSLLVLIVLSLYLSLFIARMVYGIANETPESIQDVMKYTTKNFMRYFWVGFVSGLIIFLGFLLFIIPGIYAAVVLSMVPVVFILEGEHSLGALRRSRDLVRGYFWPLLGRFILVGIITFLISMLFSLIPYVGSYIASYITIPFDIGVVFLLHRELVRING